MSSDGRILVAGGGIGGLATAIGLRKAGLDVLVLEQAPEVGKLGSGLHLWGNALRALRELGCEEQAMAIGTVVERSEFMNHRGKLIAEWATGDIGRRANGMTVGLKRAELQQVLADALDADALRLSAKVTGYEQDGSGIVVRLADGGEESGSVLVGADGNTSLLREALLADGPPRYAGYVGYRAIVADPPPEFPPGTFRLYSGRKGAWILFYHVGHGRLYWLGLAKEPAGGFAAGPEMKAKVLERYARFPAEVVRVLENTAGEDVTRTDMVDRDPAERWGEGRVTLLGDAAHPITPNLGRGAGLALEDAVVLARLMREHDDPVAALRAYEERRIPRTARLVLSSRAIGERAQWDNPVRALIRDNIAKILLRRAVNEQEKEIAFEF